MTWYADVDREAIGRDAADALTAHGFAAHAPLFKEACMFEGLQERFREVMPKAEFCSLRAVEERNEIVSVRQNVLEPIQTYEDRGAMITVVEGGGYGYAATPDLSTAGLRRAVEEAREWARRTAGRMVFDFSKIRWPQCRWA